MSSRFVTLASVVATGAALRKSSARSIDCFSMYDGQPLVQLNATSDAELQEMTSQVESTGCTSLGEDDSRELMAICSAEVAGRLLKQYAEKSEMLQSDAGAFYRRSSGEARPFVEVAGTALGSLSTDFYADWRNYEARLGRVQAVVAGSNGVATFEQIGTSVENRPIYAVRIRGAGWASGSPRVIANYQQHAREWIAGMAGVYAVEEAVKKAAEDPSFLAGAELVLVPLSNPDGILYSETNDRMWRKNRRINAGSRCLGVDLNRNWLPAWEVNNQFCGQTHSGPAAFSEPETQALRSVIDEAQATLHLDVHAYSELIIAPYGFTTVPHPRRKELDVPGLAMQKAIQDTHGKVYQYGGSEVLYASKGVARDYLSSNGGFGWTIELRPTRYGGGGFAPPATEIVPTAEEMMAALYVAIDWAKNPVTTAPPAPSPAPPTDCDPAYSTGPDSDGDCKCNSGLTCYEGGTRECTYSASGNSGWKSTRYFLPSCQNCKCQ